MTGTVAAQERDQLSLEDFRQNYRLTLRRFLPRRDEAAREAAYDLGRRAFTASISLLDVCRVHHDSSLELLSETRAAEQGEIFETTGELLLEVLAAYDMTHRSVLDP
ncbi:phosphatase RsbU N-terminal domain-containing protein [Terracoccus sp. 273MFTsu3.1]|uniref:phosphatase RsbU N-terminal domain-containing protein n=1 Tax=Terracoccus sp. 273MFTsu3.1 TaxID=1172188 RepID=UPI000365D365|nr:phosphatase RsbU N-terminal domain-containing protein [Terracoccus sp. 273MFTsu3.1]